MRPISHRRSRKAVAPVLATLLMVAVAVAMSVIIFMWSQGFLAQTSESTGSQQGTQNQAAQSSISIENALFTSGATGTNVVNTPRITILIRNVGAVAVKLGSVSVSGPSSNAGFTGTLLVGSLAASGAVTANDGLWAYVLSSVSIPKGGSATLTITQATVNATIPLTEVLSGDTLTLKVTTGVGTFAQSTFTVP